MKKPKCYKYHLWVPRAVYDFMVSDKGVGSAKLLFKGGYAGEIKPYSVCGYYKTKREVIERLCWLIDWYHAAQPQNKCVFANVAMMCNLC